MKQLLWIVGAVLLLAACDNGTSAIGDDEELSRADQLVGQWREIGSAETRSFGGDGTTSIEASQSGAVSATSRREGTYRLVSSGKIEIQLAGEGTTEWAVSFGHVAGRVLKMTGPDGQTHGYVDASTLPSYAPTTAGDGSPDPAR